MTDRVEYIYKTTNYYNPDDVRCVLWNDEEINIEWPVEHLSCPIKEDHRGVPLKFAELYK
jgi:dTDP-4-dehydrorhamnose 3,5-epimerase